MRIPLPQVGLSTNTAPVIGPGPAPGVSGDVTGRQLQQLGQGALAAGTAAMGIASELRLEHDTTITKEAYTQLADYATEVLENPKDGYFTKEGKKAVGYERAKALGSIEKRMRELEGELGTDVAKGMFREQSKKAFADIKRKVYGHEATERRVWALGQTRAMQSQSARDAVAAGIRGDTPVDVADGAELAGAEEDRAYGRQNPATAIGTTGKNVAPGQPQEPQGQGQEPGSLRGKTYAQAVAEDKARRQGRPSWQIHLDTAIEQVEEESRMLGESAELRRERVLKLRTEVHESIVRGMLSQGRTKEARAWLEKVPEKHMAVGARLGLQQALQDADRADRSYAVANEIIDQLAAEDAAVVTIEGPNGEEIGLDLTTWERELERSSKPGGTGAGIHDSLDTTTMLSRASERLRQRFEAGEIDARERDMAMAKIKEDHAIRVSQWNAEAQDTLRKTEQWFEANPDVRDPDSPSFPSKLRDKLNRFGSVDSARKIGAARGARVTDPVVYHQMLQDYESGAFKNMLPSQLFNRYYAHLGSVEWNEAQSYHALANKASDYKPPPDDEFYGVEKQILDVAKAAEIISGVDKDGYPRPKNPDEAAMLIEFKRELNDRINVENKALSKSSKNQLTTAEKVQIASEIAMLKPGGGRTVVRWNENEWFTWIDPEIRTFDRRVPDEQLDRRYVKLQTGVEVELAKIPAGARQMVQDGYRLSLVPKDQRAGIRDELLRYGWGQPKGSTIPVDRDKIEAMWARLGLVTRAPNEGALAEQWLRMKENPGSRWYKWGEAK